jgi:hypothetical protein
MAAPEGRIAGLVVLYHSPLPASIFYVPLLVIVIPAFHKTFHSWHSFFFEALDHPLDFWRDPVSKQIDIPKKMMAVVM